MFASPHDAVKFNSGYTSQQNNNGTPEVLLYHDEYFFDRLPESILAIGASNSGKTFAICYFIQSLRNKLRDVLFFTGSDIAAEFRKIVDRPKIFTDLDEQVLEAFFLEAEKHAKDNIPEMNELQQRLDSGEITELDFKKEKRKILDDGKHHFLVYIEDMGVEESQLKSREILKMYKMGRHYNLWVIISVQSISSCPREIIRQARITWTSELEGTCEQLWKYVFTKFESYQEFRSLFILNIQNYWVMIRDKARTKHRGKTCYFVWKAPPVANNHKIGCPELRATLQFIYDEMAEKRNFDRFYEERMKELRIVNPFQTNKPKKKKR